MSKVLSIFQDFECDAGIYYREQRAQKCEMVFYKSLVFHLLFSEVFASFLATNVECRLSYPFTHQASEDPCGFVSQNQCCSRHSRGCSSCTSPSQLPAKWICGFNLLLSKDLWPLKHITRCLCRKRCQSAVLNFRQ